MSKLSHQTLRIKAQSIYEEVKRWRRIIKKTPQLKALLQFYPDPVIQLLIDQDKMCLRCGSREYEATIDESEEGIHYCSDCPDQEDGN